MASSIVQSVAAVTPDFTVIKFACVAHTDGAFSPAYSDTDDKRENRFKGRVESIHFACLPIAMPKSPETIYSDGHVYGAYPLARNRYDLYLGEL